MSAPDRFEEGIEATAECWQPDEQIARWQTDCPTAPIIETRAPIFDGCCFCCGPSLAVRTAQRDAGTELAAAIDWLDTVRAWRATNGENDDRAVSMEREAIETMLESARAMVAAVLS